ncbi:copper resistance protein NlpE [Porphyromonas catoniae]|uniref:copper resistance protein NlpE n=1 Tax=Porphyromonas catoniae TaxID=41976 RepID=UPI0028CFD956|nr:copper resistance protein NlpE [Porphyromonas catoniae]
MKKVFVSFAVMALALASCQGKTDASSTDSAAVDSMTVVEQPMAAQTNEAILGTYEGVLPGADGSVTTKITLNADGTYSKHEEFSKAGAEPIDENGTYKLDATTGLVTLITPSSNMETYYKVAGGTLTLLDQTTKELPTGELAAQYVLNKK